MKVLNLPLIFLACLLAAVNAHAELRLADIFQSRMVLQRDKEVPVWGWADPGATVEVKFGGQTATATAGQDGMWMTKLKPMPANANNQPMTVTSGGETLTFDDVVVGEVWVAAGQSNMNAGGPDKSVGIYPHYQSDGNSTAPMRVTGFGFGAELEPVKDFPPQGRSTEPWKDIEIQGSSALPYYFARVVRDGADVPVGMIRVAYSGTNQTAWMAKETLDQFSGGSDGTYYDSFKKQKDDGLAKKPKKTKDGFEIANWDDLKEQEQRWLAAPKGRWPGEGLRGMDFVNWPTALYNTRIHPLAPYAIRGVIWHQGEGGPRNGYGERLVAMFKQWREVFGQDFYAIFGTLSRMSTKQPPVDPVREGFYRSWTNDGIRLAGDLGDDKMEFVEFYDLGNDSTHFHQKAEAGRRMGLAALDLAYNQDHIYTGPRAVDYKFDGPTAYVKFDHVGERIIYEPSIDGISGVILLDPKANRQWANVEVINEDTIKVSHPEIAEAAMVAYAQAINPHETLFNSAGLPASPFQKANQDMGNLREPKDSGAYVKKSGKGGSIHIGHMRRNGYQVEWRGRNLKGETEVKAYIPSDWSDYEVYVGGESVSANTVDEDGKEFASFQLPAGKLATICEKGQFEQFKNVDRY